MHIQSAGGGFDLHQMPLMCVALQEKRGFYFCTMDNWFHQFFVLCIHHVPEVSERSYNIKIGLIGKQV